MQLCLVTAVPCPVPCTYASLLQFIVQFNEHMPCWCSIIFSSMRCYVRAVKCSVPFIYSLLVQYTWFVKTKAACLWGSWIHYWIFRSNWLMWSKQYLKADELKGCKFSVRCHQQEMKTLSWLTSAWNTARRWTARNKSFLHLSLLSQSSLSPWLPRRITIPWIPEIWLLFLMV